MKDCYHFRHICSKCNSTLYYKPFKGEGCIASCGGGCPCDQGFIEGKPGGGCC